MFATLFTSEALHQAALMTIDEIQLKSTDVPKPAISVNLGITLPQYIV